MKCDCINLCNDALKNDNAELDSKFTFDFETGKMGSVLCLPLRKINPSRKPLPSMVVTYCPICGTRAHDEEKPKKKSSKANAKK